MIFYRQIVRTAAVTFSLALALALISRLSLTSTANGSDKAIDQQSTAKSFVDELGAAATNESGAACRDQAGKLIVHEWGTFTSFSGSNGAQLEFRPLRDVDLPDFVSDLERQIGEPLFSKSRVRARIRMETPVTYFYTDQERTVQASVGFPEGLLTEFYPPVASMIPTKRPITADQPRLAGGKLDWGQIHLIPAHSLAPDMTDLRAKSWLQSLIADRILPNDGTQTNHYYRARQTDSAFVHVHIPKNEGAPFQISGDFIEKFLFYRGVGKFDQPLHVMVAEDGRVRVTNSGQPVIESLIRVTVAGQTITVSELDRVRAKESVDFPSEEKQVTPDELQEIVVKSLIRQRLYQREALAMVKTWADSWFAEEGTRVLYLVPQEITDRLLPLTISPIPDETVRVLVGRVEVMSPSVEQNLLEVVRLRAVHRASIARENAEKGLTEPIQLLIPTPIQKLGRLAEPALVRLRQIAKDNSVSDEAAILLQELQTLLETEGSERREGTTGRGGD